MISCRFPRTYLGGWGSLSPLQYCTNMSTSCSVIIAGDDVPSIQDENTYTLLPQLISDYLVERTTSI